MLSIAIKRWIKRIILVLVVISVTILAIRIYDTQRGPKLELWHTFVPHEMRAAEIDKASWADYMKAENNIFDEVRKNVTEKLEPRTEIPLNRYYSGSSIYPQVLKTTGIVLIFCSPMGNLKVPWYYCMV